MIRTPRLLTTLTLGGLAALAVAAAPAPTAAPAVTAAGEEFQIFDDESLMADCTQFVPRQTPSVSGVTDSGAEVALDVVVLIDTKDTLAVAKALRDAQTNAERAAAQAAFDSLVAKNAPLVASGSQSYEAMDVRYRITYDLYRPFNANGSDRDRTTTDARDAAKLIAGAKAQYGGARPAGSDLVYVLTDLDIFASGVGNGVAGMADCIGGVEWPQHAFGVGEIFPEIALPGVKFYRDGTSKVMAHELGHLMGAHHHYQSCGPHAVGEALAGGFGACSLMTNFVDFTTFEFSPLNAGIVRANAVDFAN